MKTLISKKDKITQIELSRFVSKKFETKKEALKAVECANIKAAKEYIEYSVIEFI